ncbi:MAG TPA: phosphate ABC transporter substrate-binding protein [Candidatus Limnocylindrales bacterium]|nr:phosphate ABC transporter substrate-binding protein [Candidatus Limnocylindrales bacterium]
MAKSLIAGSLLSRPVRRSQRRKRRAGRALIVVAFTLVSCSTRVSPSATPTLETRALRLYATSAALPLLEDLTHSYSSLNRDIVFEIESGSYREMLARLVAGETPYFLSTYLPPDDAQQVPLWAAPVARDGIAAIVHPGNPVTSLTTAQLRAIYESDIQNWRELGGADMPITVFTREDGSGTRAEFERLVMGDRPTAPLARIAPSSDAMRESIARDPSAIGYLSTALLDATVRALAVDGRAPSPATLADDSYPLRSFLYVIGLREPDGSEPLDLDYRAFVAWVQGPEGQAIAARRYAPLGN